MLPQLVKLREVAVDLLFPKRCVACGKEGDYICRDCLKLLIPIEPPICPRCGRPSPAVCPECAARPARIDGVRSPFRFEGVLREAVHQFKYRNLRSLAGCLAALLFDYLAANPLPADVLVPVPLHPARLRERGYNQSALLARELGKRNGLPVAGGLVRSRKTPPQARTGSLEERLANIAGAFECVDDSLDGRNVLLVDDVATSGATLNACAAALKNRGAASVWGLALAREI
ncbi:MAG: ComF family protein [Chloroflexi bacterium]|nr:ComF family protein [Chloroflexota bacterium]